MNKIHTNKLRFSVLNNVFLKSLLFVFIICTNSFSKTNTIVTDDNSSSIVMYIVFGLCIIAFFIIRKIKKRKSDKRSPLEKVNYKVRKIFAIWNQYTEKEKTQKLKEIEQDYLSVFSNELEEIETSQDAMKVYHKIKKHCLYDTLAIKIRQELVDKYILVDFEKVTLDNIYTTLEYILTDIFIQYMSQKHSQNEIVFLQKVLEKLENIFNQKIRGCDISFDNDEISFFHKTLEIDTIMTDFMCRVALKKNNKKQVRYGFSKEWLVKFEKFILELDYSKIENIKTLDMIEELIKPYFNFNSAEIIFNKREIYYLDFIKYVVFHKKYRYKISDYIRNIDNASFYNSVYNILNDAKMFNFKIIDSLINASKKLKLDNDYSTLIESLITIHWNNLIELKEISNSYEVLYSLSTAQKREVSGRIYELESSALMQQKLQQTVQNTQESKQTMKEALHRSKNAEEKACSAFRNAEKSLNESAKAKRDAESAANSARSAASSAAASASAASNRGSYGGW